MNALIIQATIENIEQLSMFSIVEIEPISKHIDRCNLCCILFDQGAEPTVVDVSRSSWRGYHVCDRCEERILRYAHLHQKFTDEIRDNIVNHRLSNQWADDEEEE